MYYDLHFRVVPEHPFPLITRVIMGQYCDKFRPIEYQKIECTI